MSHQNHDLPIQYCLPPPKKKQPAVFFCKYTQVLEIDPMVSDFCCRVFWGCKSKSSWWFQPIWQICSSKLDDFPRDRDENTKHLSCHQVRNPSDISFSWVLISSPLSSVIKASERSVSSGRTSVGSRGGLVHLRGPADASTGAWGLGHIPGILSTLWTHPKKWQHKKIWKMRAQLGRLWGDMLIHSFWRGGIGFCKSANVRMNLKDEPTRIHHPKNNESCEINFVLEVRVVTL